VKLFSKHCICRSVGSGQWYICKCRWF